MIEPNPDWQAKVNGLLQSLDRHGAISLKSTGATIGRDGERFRVTWPPYGRTRAVDSPHTALMLARGPMPPPPQPSIVGGGSKFGPCPF